MKQMETGGDSPLRDFKAAESGSRRKPWLSPTFLAARKRQIEAAAVDAVERFYGHGAPVPLPDFRPQLKEIERIVSFYDYAACGISAIAPRAAAGDTRAQKLIRVLQKVLTYYTRKVYGHEVPERGIWNVPLRRSLLHIALAYRVLEPTLSASARARFRALVERHVPLAIEHCRGFLPGRTDLHLVGVNNHTAIFAQGIFQCGLVFGHPEWVELTREFAERYYASGHPDGYFEEHTNAEREGGPSMVYTPLTAGCLYEIIDGRHYPREKFVRAGDFYRSFLNHRRELIPLADERTNGASAGASYGLALHSLTARGRWFVRQTLENMDFPTMSPEALAVIHHEIGMMKTGPVEPPEYLTDGAYRITLPLGIVRRNGFAAGVSALRALNRVIAPRSDYALDRQNLLYLSHRDAGVILTGIKSKHDPEFSTFRVDDDAYPVKTGTLAMGDDWAKATVFYETFTGTARWDIAERARLTLSVDSGDEVVTTLPCTGAVSVRCEVPVERVSLKGFSPYSQGNAAPDVPALRFRWRRRLVVEFGI